LISAKIADNMTNTQFKQSREIFGLGLANVVCGAVGGIPCTAGSIIWMPCRYKVFFAALAT
jgi:MFS superfamily sulfate permease-like transporter